MEVSVTESNLCWKEFVRSSNNRTEVGELNTSDAVEKDQKRIEELMGDVLVDNEKKASKQAMVNDALHGYRIYNKERGGYYDAQSMCERSLNWITRLKICMVSAKLAYNRILESKAFDAAEKDLKSWEALPFKNDLEKGDMPLWVGDDSASITSIRRWCRSMNGATRIDPWLCGVTETGAYTMKVLEAHLASLNEKIRILESSASNDVVKYLTSCEAFYSNKDRQNDLMLFFWFFNDNSPIERIIKRIGRCYTTIKLYKYFEELLKARAAASKKDWWTTMFMDILHNNDYSNDYNNDFQKSDMSFGFGNGRKRLNSLHTRYNMCMDNAYLASGKENNWNLELKVSNVAEKDQTFHEALQSKNDLKKGDMSWEPCLLEAKGRRLRQSCFGKGYMPFSNSRTGGAVKKDQLKTSCKASVSRNDLIKAVISFSCPDDIAPRDTIGEIGIGKVPKGSIETGSKAYVASANDKIGIDESAPGKLGKPSYNDLQKNDMPSSVTNGGSCASVVAADCGTRPPPGPITETSAEEKTTEPKETEEVISNWMTINLSGQPVEQGLEYLKDHLEFGVTMRTVQYLRVITGGCGIDGSAPGKLGKAIVALLEKEGLEWEEEKEKPGCFLITFDGRKTNGVDIPY